VRAGTPVRGCASPALGVGNSREASVRPTLVARQDLPKFPVLSTADKGWLTLQNRAGVNWNLPHRAVVKFAPRIDQREGLCEFAVSRGLLHR